MSEKKPRLFYFEEACESWTPAPERLENIIEADQLDEGPTGELEIRFRRFDMTDEEFDALPEV